MSTPLRGERHPLAFPLGAELPPDDIAYGPDIAGEAELRLLGDLAGRRVLHLGSRDGRSAVTLARRGARVIAVEPSADLVAASRWYFEREGARIELHQADLADLASVRADSIDLVLSIYSLSGVDDLPRAFRQVHRVMRQGAPFVFSLPHPASSMIEPRSDVPLLIRRSYWDRSPRTWTAQQISGSDHVHTTSEILTHLGRTNFRIDVLLEPEPAAAAPRSRLWSETMRWIPSTLIVRARKLGI